MIIIVIRYVVCSDNIYICICTITIIIIIITTYVNICACITTSID